MLQLPLGYPYDRYFNTDMMAKVNQEKEDAADMIELVASDGSRHQVPINVAMLSSTLRSILEGNFEDSDGIIELPTMRGEVIDKVIEYLKFKHKKLNDESDDDDDDDMDDEGITNFEVPTELSLDLLLAADYLDV